MHLTANAIRLLAEKGLTASDIAELADELERANVKRTANAERQARFRARRASEIEQTESVTDNVTSNVTDNVTDVTQKEVSPTPPSRKIPLKGEYITTPTRKADRDPEGFGSFWEAYPRRVGKDEARKAFVKAVKRGAVLGELIGAVERDKARQWAGRDVEMIPHPSTWLNQGRWQDEPPQQEPTRSSHERRHENPGLERSSSNLERAFSGAEVASRLRTVQSQGGF